ncbi:regulator of G-protein signaling loco isoform X2 [Macrosteles quadrilineatus]|uniref:regulator of G-protein signaling loco isoform X2 n=1 Tax=Macrosteles quadrilineatus TaxID=74068 RepID=UPI0023E33E28|nr:regulator of G-protein signaling loco isoform X2 [Macrosteles quadrilineatus]
MLNMQPVRRRKKRPNYGVRTVELSRGKNGFGFTISGQQPCILSCIVPGSPAENAGLRAGDYLVAVEGQSVSKVPHDDVVRLIGASTGVLKLQIAENYYSDSSDDDVVVTARQKPKYPHKPRNNTQNVRASGTTTQQSRAAKVVRDLRTGAMFEEQVAMPVDPKLSVLPSPLRNIKLLPELNSINQWKPPNLLSAPLSRIIIPGTSNDHSSIRENIEEEAIYQAVVGYLGTIEMPRKLPPGSRLQIVRGCIKRLRAEKRSHTAVLMSIYNQSLKLTNSSGQVLAVYPADRVTFCGASSEEDRRYFGIVTTSADEDPSNSCHVFAVDTRSHAEHLQRAQSFKIECNIEHATGQCREFPQNCDPIITPIRMYYEAGGMRQNEVDEPVMANSPQPSNDSTTTTSNSDSGIGFRDDCGNQSDRILVVDVQNQRLHIQQIDDSDQPTHRVSTVQCTQRLTVRAMPDPVVPSGHRSQSPLSTSSDSPEGINENMSFSSGAAKSPDVTMQSAECNKSNASEKSNSMVFNGVEINGNRSADDMSLGSARSQDALLMSYKLSPKVFNVPHMQAPPMSHSLEDLKVTEQTRDQNASSLNRSQWGSLQELRSFVSDCFESSTAVQNLHEDPEEGVSCWASSFEKLLEDPIGLQTFAEFLKKEFSHENIYFWVACERYRWLEDVSARQEAAHEIFEKHLAVGASEPVNVDSQARQVSQEELNAAEPSLFLQAQKQIFNLMKFDSYPRFIKSELYKECLLREISGEALPVRGKLDTALQLHHNTSLIQAHSKLKKSRSDAEERRRKSLLPWSRKARCKSRDRDRSDAESVSSSRSSLASWDLTLSVSLCRVVLPDGATAVVQIRPPQTVGQLVVRLLDKRGLRYNSFQVFVGHSNKQVGLEEDASVLGAQEVRVEDRVVFRLDLPNRKTVAVKSKQGKTLAQVLRPILHRYGYRLEMVTLCLMSENEVVEPMALVDSVNTQRLQVLTRSTPTECAHLGWRTGECHNKVKSAPTLDEITNRVFEELLQGKADNLTQASDQSSVRSDDWGSEHSSGILGRFLRRDSAFIEKSKDGRHKNKKVAKYSALGSEEGTRGKAALSKLPPLIAKWKPQAKTDGKSESDVLYEGLKRAQRSRLEDQRGTEINFELPDFLKDKENTPQTGKKVRKLRRESEVTGNSKFYQSVELSQASSQESLTVSRSVDQSFTNDGIIPSNEAAEEYFLGGDRTQTPPPLPPKPKHLPPTTCWPPQAQPRTRPARVYLDQPSSSFV